MKRNNKFFSMLYVVLCLAFFYLPILVTMIFSFNSSKSLTRFTGFSLRWYQELLGNGEVIKAVYVSVTIAIIATIVSTILGTITAIGLSKSKKVIKELLLNINNIPILNPEIVTAISLMLLFSSLGFRKGYLTMLLAHIAFCTPYVITSVYPKVRALDPNMANAAMDLGATPFQALTKVIVPMIKEGIFAGALLAFTMSFDDFVISYFVSGNGVKNISIVVYNMTKRINPTINALSTIVIVVIIVVLLLSNLLPKFKNKARKLNRKAVKIVSVVLVVAVTAGLIKWGFVAQSTHVLKVYNAGEYMDLSLLEDFEKEYDCTIVYETFESNEMMYTKLSSGETYDVLIPSDYMIERLIKEEYLQALDWKEIPNKKNLLNDVMNQSYDPGNRYTVPTVLSLTSVGYNETELKKRLKSDCPVFYFYASDEALVRSAAAKAEKFLSEEAPDTTTLDGPTPSVEDIVLAAGTISFFGGRRLVMLPLIRPSAYSDKDLQELCDTLSDTENAVFVLTSLLEEKYGKIKPGKREQKLIAACEKLGYCVQITKPGRAALQEMARTWAGEYHTTFAPGAEAALLDR